MTIQRTLATAATLVTLSYISFLALGNALRGGQVNAASVDRGNVSIVYRPVEDEQLKPLRQDLQRSRLFESIATDLNKTISLPRNVNVEFLECGSADAYYDGKAIGICYELMQRYVDRFAPDSTSSEDAALHAGLFTLFHELGHLLIDQWDLPVTGREEDAVDEFAAIMLLEANQGEAALSGARQFAADAEDWQALPFWDDHGLDMQRFYNVSCFVYGSDPKAWVSMVGDDGLPQERAETCPADYQQKSTAWRRLLQPYRKQNLELSVSVSRRSAPTSSAGSPHALRPQLHGRPTHSAGTHPKLKSSGR